MVCTPKPNLFGMTTPMGIRWAGNVVCIEENRNTHRVLDWKTEGKGQLEKPRLRCEDNIKIEL
jgi:hypothetical protein